MLALEKKVVSGFYVTKWGNIILRNDIFELIPQLSMNSLNDPFTFWNKALMTLLIFVPELEQLYFP